MVTGVWTRGGTPITANSTTLNFDPLLLSNSGQYVCTATVLYDPLCPTLINDSDSFEVTIQSEFLHAVTV